MQANYSFLLKAVVLTLLIVFFSALGAWIEGIGGFAPALCVVAYLWLFRKERLATLAVDDGVLQLHKGTGKNKCTTSKQASITIKDIIQWEGYEGRIIDIIWSDGDVWSLTEHDGISAQALQRRLKALGITVPELRQDYRVFRPQTEETNRTERSSEPLPAG